MQEKRIARGISFLTGPPSGAIVSPETFTAEQKEIAATGRRFSETEIVPRVREIEAKTEGLIPTLMRKAGELGMLMVDVPAEYGGLGLGVTTSMILAEQFSRVASFSVSLGAHSGIGTLPLVYFGNAEQKTRYLPDLATGKRLAAYALTEATSGSDALAARTEAVRTPDGKHFVLSGTKQFITNAAFADLFTIFAKVDGDQFSAFLVDRTTPGLSVGREEHKMGIRGSSTCPLILDNAKVPAANLLGEAGKGHKIAFNTLNLGRIKLGAGTIGACKYAIELSATYARERMQFGRSIGSFGLVAKKLAEMALLAFVGETMVYRTTGLLDELLEHADGDAERVDAIEELSVEASITKVFGSEALDFCADEAVQIHGGYGFLEDYPVERLFRDSRINRIFEGTNEINRLIVPGTILKRALRGEIPLLDDVSRIRDGIAKGELPRSADRSDLAVAAQVAELSKWVSLYVLAVAAETYHVKVADEQEILGELADMITRVYAIDSVVTRVQKIAGGADERRRTLANDMLMAFVPPAYSRIVHTGRHVLMDISEGSALSTHLAAIDKLRVEWPCKVIAAKRRVAAAVLETGGYPL